MRLTMRGKALIRALLTSVTGVSRDRMPRSIITGQHHWQEPFHAEIRIRPSLYGFVERWPVGQERLYGSSTNGSAGFDGNVLQQAAGNLPETFAGSHQRDAQRVRRAGQSAEYSMLAGQMQTQGKSLQTFETGSVLLATEDPKTGQKLEVVVENDSLRGDQDDIELPFRRTKTINRNALRSCLASCSP